MRMLDLIREKNPHKLVSKKRNKSSHNDKDNRKERDSYKHKHHDKRKDRDNDRKKHKDSESYRKKHKKDKYIIKKPKTKTDDQ